MRARTIPIEPKEEIVRLEYEPKQMFAIHVVVGSDVDGTFTPIPDQIGEVITVSGEELTVLEENQQIQDAIGVIMAHAWTKVDQKRGIE